MRMKHARTGVALVLLGVAGAAEATAVSLGAGGSPIERIYLGVLLGLAGALPAMAAVFALLAVMSCHSLRSQVRQGLLGAAVGSVAYGLCVLVGSITLGPFLEPDHPLRSAIAQALVSFSDTISWEVLIIAVFLLPALPVALCSMWFAHSRPETQQEK